MKLIIKLLYCLPKNYLNSPHIIITIILIINRLLNGLLKIIITIFIELISSIIFMKIMKKSN